MSRIARRALVLGAACGLAIPRLSRADADFAAPAATLVRAAAPRRDARGLAMKDQAGHDMQIADYADRLVILNLWAPWCLPCRREMPSIARLAARLDPAHAAVVPLAFDWRGANGVRRFYTEAGIDNLPVLIGDGDNLKAVLGIETLPTTVLIDAQGTMFDRVDGEARWDDAATFDWINSLI